MRTMESWLQDRISLGKDYQRQNLEDEPEGEGDLADEEEKIPLNEETKESVLLSKATPVMKQTKTSLAVVSSSRFFRRKSKVLVEKVFTDIKLVLQTETQKEHLYIKISGTEIDEHCQLERFKNKKIYTYKLKEDERVDNISLCAIKESGAETKPCFSKLIFK